MLGRPLIDFVKDERGKRVMREQLQRLREGEVVYTEYEVIRKDGAAMWVGATPVWPERLSTSQAVTEQRKRCERAKNVFRWR